MNKRPVLFLVIVAVLAVALTAGYIFYQRTYTSPQYPVISFDATEIKVTTGVSDGELLRGVTATDPEDGDVTQSLLVENVSNIFNGNCAKVSYVAFDSKNHMSRAERTIRYTDYKPPVFSMSHPMVFRLSATLNILNYISAEDMFDGDISHKVIYSIMGNSTNLNVQGEHEIELRAVNSKGDVAKLKTTVEISDTEPNKANIQLTDYLVYVPQGTEFKPEQYFKSYMSNAQLITDKAGVTIDSNVDTETPGTYTVTYSTGYGDTKSRSRLIVVVE